MALAKSTARAFAEGTTALHQQRYESAHDKSGKSLTGWSFVETKEALGGYYSSRRQTRRRARNRQGRSCLPEGEVRPYADLSTLDTDAEVAGPTHRNVGDVLGRRGDGHTRQSMRRRVRAGCVPRASPTGRPRTDQARRMAHHVARRLGPRPTAPPRDTPDFFPCWWPTSTMDRLIAQRRCR